MAQAGREGIGPNLLSSGQDCFYKCNQPIPLLYTHHSRARTCARLWLLSLPEVYFIKGQPPLDKNLLSLEARAGAGAGVLVTQAFLPLGVSRALRLRKMLTLFCDSWISNPKGQTKIAEEAWCTGSLWGPITHRNAAHHLRPFLVWQHIYSMLSGWILRRGGRNELPLQSVVIQLPRYFYTSRGLQGLLWLLTPHSWSDSVLKSSLESVHSARLPPAQNVAPHTQLLSEGWSGYPQTMAVAGPWPWWTGCPWARGPGRERSRKGIHSMGLWWQECLVKTEAKHVHLQ